MQIKFEPHYTITPKIAKYLMRIQAAKEEVSRLPLTPIVLNFLRETARLNTTHYSTLIEGNRLTLEQIELVLNHKGHFPGRERDEREVRGYYAALEQMERWVTAGCADVTEKIIQTFHALVMADGKIKVKPTAYRDGQNVIREGSSGAIVYMPPEAKDVKPLMAAMVSWINGHTDLPCPIVAGIAHYQFATIHPYYDGNGRTARLLATFIMHLGGYGLKGLYSLEEYYARNLNEYYQAISIGESHNYYLGRAEADITSWIEYFIEGMSVSFDSVLKQMVKAKEEGYSDKSVLMQKLDPRQRRALELFFSSEATVTSGQIGQLFGLQPRRSASLCSDWVEEGFLEIVDASNKGRSYRLSPQYQELLKK